MRDWLHRQRPIIWRGHAYWEVNMILWTLYVRRPKNIARWVKPCADRPAIKQSNLALSRDYGKGGWVFKW